MLELAQLLLSIAGFGLPLGILMLMSGSVKVRNELDTLTRVISAFCIAMVCYWLIGSGIFDGNSFRGLFGFGGTMVANEDLLAGVSDLRIVFLFSIPPILVTSALAERGGFIGGGLLSIVVAILVVPVTAHWAWSSGTEQAGWLFARGLQDHTGAVVVFAAAGFAALATTITIGPRKGRFLDRNARIYGHSPTFLALGMCVMVFGLATLSAAQADYIAGMAGVLFKVLLGASFAAMAAIFLLVTRRKQGGAIDLITSALAGAVALLAFAPETSPASAALTGLFAGWFSIGLRRMLAALEIDDPGDLIAAFIAGGIMGGLLAPILWAGSAQMLVNQMITQLLGIVVISLWSFGVTYIAAQILHRTSQLRVSEAEEAQGLSRVHFSHQSELDFMTSQLSSRSNGDSVVTGDHSGRFGELANSFSQSVVKLRGEIHRTVERIRSSLDNPKQVAAITTRIRLAEDTLRVKAEEVLMLLEAVLQDAENQSGSAEFEAWLFEAVQIVIEPIHADLEQFSRHLPLQADLEELENVILAAADEVDLCAHQVELLKDLADARTDGFFARDHSCDLASILKDQSKMLNALAEVRNSPIQIDCPVEKGLVVAGDANAFSRILNLTVEGALNRVTREIGKPVRLELREHTSSQFVLFECLDTGTSLTNSQIRAILDPLANNVSLGDLGIGQILPLILVVRLVEAIGGEVTLSSQHGFGTLLQCRFRKLQRRPVRKRKKAA